MSSAPALRLHLGCGGMYLEGYRNIDLPPSEHGVQEGIRPDEYADITQLDIDDGPTEREILAVWMREIRVGVPSAPLP